MVTESKDRYVNTDAPMKNDHVKRQPHERDESPDAQDQRPRGVIQQAAQDLAQGLVDTDMRGGNAGLDKVAPQQPGATGQANPLPDRAKDMRDHDSTVPSRGNKQ